MLSISIRDRHRYGNALDDTEDLHSSALAKHYDMRVQLQSRKKQKRTSDTRIK